MGKNINLSYAELKDILELTSKKKHKNKKRRNAKRAKKRGMVFGEIKHNPNMSNAVTSKTITQPPPVPRHSLQQWHQCYHVK